MEAKWILPLILVLLVLQIQPVYCPQEPMPSPNNSTEVICNAEDPCGNSTIVCSPVVSSKDRIIPWFTFAVSFVILFCPILRIKELKPNPQADSQTLFWWFLYLGFLAYIIWMFYLWPCHHPRFSAFPVILTCAFGLFIHPFLLVPATKKTSALGDRRSTWMIRLTLFVTVGAVVCRKRPVLGWIGVALSVLSHACRIASTDYYAKINWYLLFASAVGSVNGFLWLFHPQLCISKEYKNYLFISLMVTGDSDLMAY